MEQNTCHICREPTQLVGEMNLHETIEKDLICMKEYGMNEQECDEKLKILQLYRDENIKQHYDDFWCKPK